MWYDNENFIQHCAGIKEWKYEKPLNSTNRVVLWEKMVAVEEWMREEK